MDITGKLSGKKYEKEYIIVQVGVLIYATPLILIAKAV